MCARSEVPGLTCPSCRRVLSWFLDVPVSLPGAKSSWRDLAFLSFLPSFLRRVAAVGQTIYGHWDADIPTVGDPSRHCQQGFSRAVCCLQRPRGELSAQ